MVPFSMMVYLEDQDPYVPDNEVPARRASAEYFRHDLRAA